jgi:hypothetical protein
MQQIYDYIIFSFTYERTSSLALAHCHQLLSMCMQAVYSVKSKGKVVPMLN